MKSIVSVFLLGSLGLSLAACGSEGPIVQPADAEAATTTTQQIGVSAIYGTWASSADLCGETSDARVVTVGDGRLESTDYACTMTQPTQNAEGWLSTLDCTGRDENPDVTERVRFVPGEGRLTLNFIDRTERNDERLVSCGG